MSRPIRLLRCRSRLILVHWRRWVAIKAFEIEYGAKYPVDLTSKTSPVASSAAIEEIA